ncbi:MAG: hypothetical protein U1E65_18085 [Myxococcota bacterium]
MRARALLEQEDAESESPAPASASGPAPAPVSGRLLDVQRVETIARRAGAPLPTPEAQAVDRAGALISIDFARSTDRSQAASPMGGDLILILGIATGEPERRISKASPAISSLSVAIDGLVYAVRLSAGDTAEHTAERLIEKLSLHREVSVIESSDLRAIIRILR